MISIHIDLGDYGKQKSHRATTDLLKNEKFVAKVSDLVKKKTRVPTPESKMMAKMIRQMAGPRDKTGVPYVKDTTSPYAG